MIEWYRLIALIGLMLFAGSLFAAQSLSPRFDRVSDPALRGLTVSAMLQDRQGFIWLATTNGLYRYDGYRSISFKSVPSNAKSLPSNILTSLFEDEKGSLWIGSINGLARFNPKTDDFTVFAPESGPEKIRNVRSIVSDRRGGMWIGTWGGLQHFNPDNATFRQFAHDPTKPDSLADNNVNALAVDAKGGLWVALWHKGVDYLAPNKSSFQHFPQVDTSTKPESPLNTARALLLDSRGRLWLGTEAGAVVWQTGTDWSLRRRLTGTAELSQSRIASIVEDQDGTVWAGSITDGLARWDETSNRFNSYTSHPADRHSLSNRTVRSLMLDRQGLLWIGGEDIARLNLSSRGFARYLPQKASIELNTSRAISLEDTTHLWMGSLDGLHLLDLETQEFVKSFRAEPDRQGALGSNTIYSLYRDLDRSLWVGTMNGLYKLNTATNKFQHIPIGKGAGNYINKIRPGSGATLWLVSGNGVVHYHPRTGAMQRYTHDSNNQNSRSITSTTDVLEDKKGRVWMVDRNGGGLDMLDVSTNKFKNYRAAADYANSLKDNRATQLHEDDQGRLWVATASGLTRVTFQPDGSPTFRSWGNENGLPSTSVYSIESDPTGNIWLTTDVGISKFNTRSEAFDHFTATDGITENFAYALSAADSSGKIYFSSRTGVTGITPHAVDVNKQTPKIAITDISIFNRSLRNGMPSESVKLGGSIFEPKTFSLSWRESVFAIEFSALQFDASEALRYTYRLEGFDRDWVETDAMHRIATYTNLDPGKYVFRVKAANSKGIWNEAGIALPVTITPPFWLTWWFRVLMAITVVGSLGLAYRLRIRRLVKRKKELEALVAERTAELEASNNRLANLSMTDGLTGIANRRRFDDVFANEWNRAKRTHQSIAVAMLDVDWFKKYNDHYGHQAGDECLRQVARTVAANVRRAGDLAARYGGEEFVLIAPGSNSVELKNLATAICQSLELLALPHAMSPYGKVTASIGVASIIPSDNDIPETLLKQADDALYLAKETGRNRAIAQ